MKTDRIIELLKVEKECVQRASGKYKDQVHICSRDCWKCDLVQDSDELIDMYTSSIRLLTESMPKLISLGNLMTIAVFQRMPIYLESRKTGKCSWRFVRIDQEDGTLSFIDANGEAERFSYDEYNFTFRCFNHYVSDKQRKGLQWDTLHDGGEPCENDVSER